MFSVFNFNKISSIQTYPKYDSPISLLAIFSNLLEGRQKKIRERSAKEQEKITGSEVPYIYLFSGEKKKKKNE